MAPRVTFGADTQLSRGSDGLESHLFVVMRRVRQPISRPRTGDAHGPWTGRATGLTNQCVAWNRSTLTLVPYPAEDDGRYFTVSRPDPGGLRLSFAGLTPEQIRTGVSILGEIFSEELERTQAAGTLDPAPAMV